MVENENITENTIWYSPSFKRFYQSGFDEEVAEDAIEIDKDVYKKLQNGLEEGLEIFQDSQGNLNVLPAKIFYSASTGGFYTSKIHKTFPPDSVEIDEQTYQSLLMEQAEGKIIISDANGKPITQEKPTPSSDIVKARLIANIDKDAENERQKYITAGSGQALTYLEKASQALEYSGKYTVYLTDKTANKRPNDEQYPLLKASIGIDGATMIEVAETITHSYALWLQIGAQIEAIRLKAKITIASAPTSASAKEIYNTIKWPNATVLE